MPPHPFAALLTFDEAGRREDSGVMGDGRLTLPERSFEGATTHLSLGRDERQHPKPHGISEGPKDRRSFLSFFGRQFTLAEGATARSQRVFNNRDCLRASHTLDSNIDKRQCNEYLTSIIINVKE
jgi:hypothetical protein